MSSDILAKIMASVNANANAKIEISEKGGKLTIEISASETESQSVPSDDDPPTVIDDNGTKYWQDKNGKLHRDGDKPAGIDPIGTHVYYKHGNLHRDGDKPAFYRLNGEFVVMEFYKNNKRHRDGNKPARMTKDSYQYWLDGKHILTVNHKNGVVEV